MACYQPTPASQDGRGARVKLWPPLGSANLALPCGKCIGCRTDRAIHWANRCTHEAATHDHNFFLTLTYDDDNLPEDGHLRPRDLQLFIKRLRKSRGTDFKSLATNPRASLRYFACGEYGETNNRPHYHALVFNSSPTDLTKVGKDLYQSELLRRLWRFGEHRIGACTGASAAYIAQYNLKKQGAGDHDSDGVYRPPPFLRMSRRPAIGAEWLEKYATDLQHGYVVENGRKHPIPRYYRTKITDLYPALAEHIDAKLDEHRYLLRDSKTPERLRDSEIIHKRRKEIYENRKL